MKFKPTQKAIDLMMGAISDQGLLQVRIERTGKDSFMIQACFKDEIIAELGEFNLYPGEGLYLPDIRMHAIDLTVED